MLKLNRTQRALALLLGGILSACSSSTGKIAGDVESLDGLKQMAYSSPKAQTEHSMGKIREMALKETALSIGAQSGLASRAKEIDAVLNKEAKNLSTVFNFESLILAHNVLPPVLLEGRNSLNLPNDQAIRVSNRTYKIYKQARFVTTAPDWRQYLWMDYKKPDRPNITLLPKDDEERQVWDHYVTLGWKNGIDQANTISADNLARIKEDFKGMVLYRQLLAMNMVTPPYVSHTDLGITGDSNEMHIDDRVLRITALPGLNINSKQWRAALSKNNGELKQFKQMEKLASKASIVVTDKSWQPMISPVIDSKG